MASSEWTLEHAAARVACGEALDGEAGEALENAVRLHWQDVREALERGELEPEDVAEYVADCAPVATYALWAAFAESSALRIALGDAFGEWEAPADMSGLENAMRYAFSRCVAGALRVMPDAVAELEARR